MINKNTLLVTGGSGFIGSNFIHYWLEKYPEDEIRNLDLLTYAGNKDNLKTIENLPNYKFIHGSICDSQLVHQIMEGVDVVVHFAAESHVDRSILDPGLFLDTNIIGTHVLLKASLDHKIDRFHHISTDEVFGSLELDSNLQFDETTPYHPHSPYSASKASSDHLVRTFGTTYGLKYTITNCSNNYGEYQFPEKLIPLAITEALVDRPVPVYGDGLNVRDWLYVQDHCHSIDLVLKNGLDNQTYLVGGLTDDISNLELVKMILMIMNKPDSLIKYVKDRAGHDRRYSVNWQKLENELSWKPAVTLEEGLTKTVSWYQQNQDWWQPLKDKQAEYFQTQYNDR